MNSSLAIYPHAAVGLRTFNPKAIAAQVSNRMQHALLALLREKHPILKMRGGYFDPCSTMYFKDDEWKWYETQFLLLGGKDNFLSEEECKKAWNWHVLIPMENKEEEVPEQEIHEPLSQDSDDGKMV